MTGDMGLKRLIDDRHSPATGQRLAWIKDNFPVAVVSGG